MFFEEGTPNISFEEMDLSTQEVKEIARLARLVLSPDEEVLYARQLGQIVSYIEQLESFECAPTQTSSPTLPEAEDLPAAGDVSTEDFVRNAPEALDTFLIVPQVKVTRND